MNRNQKEFFSKLVNMELTRAETKHPNFCEKITEQEHWLYSLEMSTLKALNEKFPNLADNVAAEEFVEAMEAYTAGRLVDACVELAQSAGVHFRIFEKLYSEMNMYEKTDLKKILSYKPKRSGT